MTDPNITFAAFAVIVTLAGLCALVKGFRKKLDTLDHLDGLSREKEEE